MTGPEFLLLVFALAFGFGGTFWLTGHYDLRRTNFRGWRIPFLAGLAFVLGGEFFYLCEWLLGGVHTSLAADYFLVTLGFGGLGLLDDLRGDRSVGGFRGHFRSLLRGRLTTGATKALGGGLVALTAGFLLVYPRTPLRVLVAALLIALSANALNLLDLRPGRCLFGFFAGAAALIGFLWAHHALYAALLPGAALAFAVILYPLDSSASVMLGDTGSNAFGAVLGLAGAIFFPLLWQAVLVAALIAFHVWCERYSLSHAIESNPVLRSLDRKIGVR